MIVTALPYLETPGDTSTDVPNVVTFARTPGCHVTDIIAKLMLAIDPDTYGTPIEDRFAPDTVRAWRRSGFTWEGLLTKLFAEQVGERYGLSRASELKKDGIIGTPDWIGIRSPTLWHPDWVGGGDVLYLFESKFTWKSMREWVSATTPEMLRTVLMSPKFVMWLFQMRCYCTMLETPYALLSVLFANGDYTMYVPRHREFAIEFTARELEENWTMHVRRAKKEGWI